ncbi:MULTISPECIES: dynamin family protein [unclassified Nitratiruptor]|uniref:dynamin family protein n=1 Tax=unclassified Nitratiruptor TaxID=2624044 RepID=UPI0019161652|nr:MULTISPECIES: dynamin family protein [unclassified Nitratiruptor]BCD60332.1 hypothetical protein NitYY0810_C1097 [Nitratiruptor sp. YY08-10]BCD64179.1 hypothetical protein NitYY0814_C1024 [Nitratiruptor sp. YY08-14]
MTPKERYAKLKEHLKEENPILMEVIDEYKELDAIARKIGFLNDKQTFTESISWWPLISILGTFSAGKSSFINEYLGKKVQDTGNQAVDDKFTVICYSKNEEVTTLPGVALDADPRFPFYNISKEIEKLDPKEKNINRYLQLKAVNSENIKGKILIDSPGFDADIQRDATLRITRHIIDLSDLVLIFFDARHPEPGAMRDTLNHLVEVAKNHADSDKVLYILNQIDTCAKEDNLEEIIGAWQRALSQKGIVSGRFYAIYNEAAASIEHPAIEERLKKKKDHDIAEIKHKMDKVLIDRAYRIVKNVEYRAKEIMSLAPKLQELLITFRNRVLFFDIVYILLLALLGGWISMQFQDATVWTIIAAVSIVAFFILHLKTKSWLSKRMAQKIDDMQIMQAFTKQTRWFRSIFSTNPLKKLMQEELERLINKSKSFIQKLNDQFITMKKSESSQEEKSSF